VSTEAAVLRRHGVFHPLLVQSVERLTDDAVAITFEVPSDLRDDYAFQAGQHLTVRTEIGGEEVRRNYSICAPASSGRLRVAVKRLDGGAFSGFATSGLQPGDTVDVMTPTGRFHVPLDPANAKHYCAFAAGSGITPVISIVASTLEEEPASSFTLVYGNRTTTSIMFLDELSDLKDRYPTRFRIINVLSREPQEVELFSGRLDEDKVRRLLATLIPVDSVDEWFLCGPFVMVEQVRDTLLAEGVGRSHVHMELFHVEGEAPRETVAAGVGARDEGTSSVTVVLDGRSSTFDVPHDGQRILDAALAVRSDAPYACKGGVCGTCRAKLLEGEVAMDRNFALEQDEIDAGFVLACQSRPVSDTVSLDFDQ
jgi:ring-1,2-phenylacetyl-CoA epoxidase subunit PaaE